MNRFFLSIVFSQLLLSCRHRLRIESYPPGATVYCDGEEIGTTPIDTMLWWFPFKKIPMTVTLANYRPIQFSAEQQLGFGRLSKELLTFRYKKLLGIEVRTTHQLYLVRKHGPAGTWTPEDAQRNK